MHRVLPHLTLVQPPQRTQQRAPILVLVRQPALDERLTHEGYIPELTPVRPAHHHTLGPDPHEV